MKRFLAYICLGSLLAVAACSPPPSRPNKGGRSGGEGNPNTPVGTNVPGTTPEGYDLLNCEEPDTYRGLRGWRRLANAEVKNTVVDTFGIKDLDYSEFPSDLTKKELFDTIMIANNFVNTQRFKAYQNFSSEFASKLDTNKFLPCKDSACLTQKLPAFLELAWRRPATDEDVKSLVALNETLKADGIVGDEALRIVIQAVVLSHNFLYRSELGTLEADGSYALSDYELASALSYIIWRTAPDEALRNAAAAGELSKDGGVRAYATKMFNDPRAKNTFKEFAKMWMESDKVNRTNKPDPSYSAAVKAKMIQEVGDTFSHVMFDAADKSYQALMGGTFTMAGPELDSFYNSKSENGKTAYKEADRLGLLGQAGFLSSHAAADNPNPILRGVYVLEHVLCEHFGTPPPFTPPMAQVGLSNKDLFKQHNKPGCAGCHTSIDNIGFVFENFDQYGKYRTMDAGQPIVTDNTFPLDGKDVKVTSPQEMFKAIANSQQGMQCYVREAFRYGMGRAEYFTRPTVGVKTPDVLTKQGELDRCQIENATKKMKENKGDLRTGIIEILASPGFRYRLVGKVEK